MVVPRQLGEHGAVLRCSFTSGWLLCRQHEGNHLDDRPALLRLHPCPSLCSRERKVNHLAVPAACFTHPEVSFVGLTEDAAREKAEKEGWAAKLGVAKTYYKVTLRVGEGALVKEVKKELP